MLNVYTSKYIINEEQTIYEHVWAAIVAELVELQNNLKNLEHVAIKQIYL